MITRPKRKLDMTHYVPGLLNHLSNKLSAGASAIYRERFGVGITDWRVLVQLAIAPGSTASALCERTGLDKSAVSRSFEALHDQAFISFRPTNGRRERYASLTAKGRELHDAIIVVALERERLLLVDLSATERKALLGLLNRLLERVDAVNETGV